MVTVVVASPLLLQSATIDLDVIGARCLVFFAGCSLLLAARSYRHSAARALLRLAGLGALAALAVNLVIGPGEPLLGSFFYVVVGLGAVALAAAVATGRGWRSVWWSRRAEVAESLCGSLAFAAAVVAAGVFRRLWEMTS
jgi:peptidoglycan/LPS O-acetylase OafA/YrhL